MNENLITIEELFNKNKFIPVVILDDVTKAVNLAHALLEGGISTMEITLRTPNALKVIEKIANNVPQMIIGAGTILTEDQYHLSVKHGAQYIVSPGITKELVDVSREYDVAFLPGAITPSEIMHAKNNGFKHLKFFPASSYNGYEVLKSLAAPLSGIKFCPTGGITLENAHKFLSLPNVMGVGCSFLVTVNDLANNNYSAITQIALQTQEILKQLA